MHSQKTVQLTRILFFVLATVFITLATPPKLYAISNDVIVSMLNLERQEAGLPPLSTNPLLTNSSAAKSDDMMRLNYWSHNAPDGSEPWHFFYENGYDFEYAGENLAKGFVSDDGVVKGWMNSPAHRANVLGANYSEVGISVVAGDLLGESTILVVAHFGSGKEWAGTISSEAPSEQAASNQLLPTAIGQTTAATELDSTRLSKLISDLRTLIEPRHYLLLVSSVD